MEIPILHTTLFQKPIGGGATDAKIIKHKLKVKNMADQMKNKKLEDAIWRVYFSDGVETSN